MTPYWCSAVMRCTLQSEFCFLTGGYSSSWLLYLVYFHVHTRYRLTVARCRYFPTPGTVKRFDHSLNERPELLDGCLSDMPVESPETAEKEPDTSILALRWFLDFSFLLSPFPLKHAEDVCECYRDQHRLNALWIGYPALQKRCFPYDPGQSRIRGLPFPRS